MMKTMKQTILSLLALAACVLSVSGRTVERTYISTDRHYYAAGEKIHCSLFCCGPDGLSDFSSVAYLELSSADGLAATGKVSLLGGRGAGYLILPSDLPTGNYALIAYTAVQKNEMPSAIGYGRKIISVYNTSSTSRSGGVVSGEVPESAGISTTGPVSIDCSNGSITVSSPSDATLSITVFKSDGLPSYNGESLSSFLGDLPSQGSFADNVIPEYDGEIINVAVNGRDDRPAAQLEGATLFMASPGTTSDLYCASVTDGKATYYTSNIYGEKNLAFSLAGAQADYQISIESPFVSVPAGDLPALTINPSMDKALSSLGVAMQVGKAFQTDTLFSHLHARTMSFTGNEKVSYILDDYTRFTTMQEVFTEYLYDIRARRRGGKAEIRVRCNPFFGNVRAPSDGSPLILLDGVPVMDHDIIYDFDPLLVKRIDVYPRFYTIGSNRFEGIANFVTYKGDMSGANMGANTKILGFQGVSYPEALEGKPGIYAPKLGNTVLWQPLLEVKAGSKVSLTPSVPDYHGSFIVIAEGLCSDGTPVYATSEIQL